MTHDPFAAFFVDAHRQWQQTFEQGGLGNKQDLEMQWQSYLHDCNRDRIETTPGVKDEQSKAFVRRRRGGA